MNNKPLHKDFLERDKFIVIGLTGRTGSGCTTTAHILENLSNEKVSTAKSPTIHDIPTINGEPFFKGLNKNRYEIVSQYFNKNASNFTVIKAAGILSMFWFTSKIDLQCYVKSEREYKNIKRTVSTECYRYLNNPDYKRLAFKIIADKELAKDDYELLPQFLKASNQFVLDFKKSLVSNEFPDIETDLYTKIYQSIGKSIRYTGGISRKVNDNEHPNNVSIIARVINTIIKALRKNNGVSNPTLVAIDSIRNPYEAKYFQDRYSGFYLMAIDAPPENRRAHLKQRKGFTDDAVKELDREESGRNRGDGKYTELVTPNVQKCIEISDIHIFNPREDSKNHDILKAQLIWYISLMMYPGQISPTAMERVMQIAFSAKLNSGCISRQVGAVITDKDYSIISVGWNDVAEGQVPCNLRSLPKLLGDQPASEEYSLYEREHAGFRETAKLSLDSINRAEMSKAGRNISYCFKSIQNKLDDDKNQVHTRALHAEENAMMQLAKRGSTGVKGGILFSTASPCELCSKKAYQLGISEIVYIDPYPGIAIDHILEIGNNSPKITQFRGAVGKAYHRLYEPFIAIKDEIETFFKNH